ncbi:MAG: YgiT-type zinc finger protein [Chlamydiae bacterium]|nr:YgiT-type zinc finger protein [Chlamydiota bacterium]
MATYDDCIYCSGAIQEKSERLDYRYHGQLFIVENVPVGVCNQCGEKFLTAKTVKKLDKTVSASDKPIKTIAIPVISIVA